MSTKKTQKPASLAANPSPNPIVSRMEQYRFHKRMTKTELCALIGIGQSTYNNLTTGRHSVPSALIVAKFLEADESLNARWLLCGEGDMFQDGEINDKRLIQLQRKLNDLESLYKQAERNNALLASYVERLQADLAQN